MTPLEIPLSDPHGTGQMRPWVKIILFPPNGHGTVADEWALLDGGAHTSAVPRHFVDVLGLDEAELRWGMEHGMGGSLPAPDYPDGIEIDVQGHRVTLPLAFSQLFPHALLGQDFLDKFENVNYRPGWGYTLTR